MNNMNSFLSHGSKGDEPEFFVNIPSPVVAHFLYRMSMEDSSRHGLLYGSIRYHVARKISDAQEARDCRECLINIERLTPLPDALPGWYESIDANTLPPSDQYGAHLLGWFAFDRVQMPKVVQRIYAKASRKWAHLCHENERPPLLFLFAYERVYPNEIKFDMPEVKMQLHRFDKSINTLKPISLKIRNVGDTSHAEYNDIVERGKATATSNQAPVDDHPSAAVTGQLAQSALDLAAHWRRTLRVTAGLEEAVVPQYQPDRIVLQPHQLMMVPELELQHAMMSPQQTHRTPSSTHSIGSSPISQHSNYVQAPMSNLESIVPPGFAPPIMTNYPLRQATKNKFLETPGAFSEASASFAASKPPLASQQSGATTATGVATRANMKREKSHSNSLRMEPIDAPRNVNFAQATAVNESTTGKPKKTKQDPVDSSLSSDGIYQASKFTTGQSGILPKTSKGRGNSLPDKK